MDNELLDRMRDWCDAYPESIFPPLVGDPLKKTGDYDTEEKRSIITRNSGAMGRHMIEKCLKPLIAECERLQAEVDRLTPLGLREDHGE